MAIKVRPYTPDLEGAVGELNRRLAAGGWAQRFPGSSVPTVLPPGVHPTLFVEMCVAVDDAGAVRGGYILKHQQFVVSDRVEGIANYAFPLSEGVIDRRFGLVGVSMILDAQRRNPLLFGLGLGGTDHPSARVMKGVGWSAVLVPFFFRVIRPFRFLRGISYLRRTAARRVLLDVAAFSGLGWLAVNARGLVRRAGAARARAELVAEFGDWADEIWESGKGAYSFAAVRDRATVAALYADAGDRYLILRVSEQDRPVGWAVCLDTQMSSHPYFGDMRVGTVVDCFAAAGKARVVAFAADRMLRDRGVDLIVTNQSARDWCDAFEALAYFRGPSNFALTCSKQLTARLGSLENTLPYCHMTRGDGDGPINL